MHSAVTALVSTQSAFSGQGHMFVTGEDVYIGGGKQTPVSDYLVYYGWYWKNGVIHEVTEEGGSINGQPGNERKL